MTKLNKKETIKNIMKLLDDGKLVYIGCGKLWEMYSRGKLYIGWSHYGSSANSRTIQELTWVINTIFGCKYKKIVYTYK